nr:hypothetical protein [Chroococcidiopsis cubana]
MVIGSCFLVPFAPCPHTLHPTPYTPHPTPSFMTDFWTTILDFAATTSQRVGAQLMQGFRAGTSLSES